MVTPCERIRPAHWVIDPAGDLVARLFAEEKRRRILAAAEHWPQLPAASIAVVASASPGYVSDV